ncbi:AIPR family protein [Pseudomonas xantholysinigenes]|uniref:AIPR family protein n=1 Tax=Pseudomonas xantholysinigenes TaxID=2745490 RepID=A0A9E6TVW8_9PSED|nr:AIPR family protein [Pseudomonas xantholysinigenes]QXI36864.1 AIPR family protein [Pseudomonas xantholysinigenes]
MHRITAGLLKEFVQSYELNEMDQADQFERLVNHCVITPEVVEGYDLSDVTSGSGDDGIDGCCVIIDEEVIISSDDCISTLGDGRRTHAVKLILTQAKSSETLDLGDFLKFNAAVERFCHDFSNVPEDEIQANVKEVYGAVVDRAGAISNGKLEIVLRYAYTGRYLKPREFERARQELTKKLKEGGYFSKVDYLILDREGIGKAFVATSAPIEAKIDVFSVAALPAIAGVEEAYLAVVPAKNFVRNMLMDGDEDRLRTHVFEENVRAFLGAENPVNSAIGNTIQSKESKSRFPVLNNGITVVSPDVRVQGLSISFINFQIVNGCQTSNMLWLNRNKLDDAMMVAVKVIETDSEDVFSDLVKATNSQTKIDDDQFMSLQPIARRIEEYFNSYSEDESRLYFERRDRQYVGQDVPGIKIFDLKLLARCMSSVFLGRPDLAYRFPRKIFSDQSISSAAFSPENRDIIYYTSCLVYYRMSILFGNKQIPAEARRYKWHIMALFARRVAGAKMPTLRDKKIEKWCSSIIDVIVDNPKLCKQVMNECYEAIAALGEISEDRLKRQAVYEQVLKAEVEKEKKSGAVTA